MLVNKEQVQIGVTKFVENELAKKSTGVTKFFVYFAMPIVVKKVNEYIDGFAQNPLTKDMFDSNHNLDLDAIYNMAKSAIQKSGQFVYYGILFNESDVDKLYNYIGGNL